MLPLDRSVAVFKNKSMFILLAKCLTVKHNESVIWIENVYKSKAVNSQFKWYSIYYDSSGSRSICHQGYVTLENHDSISLRF